MKKRIHAIVYAVILCVMMILPCFHAYAQGNRLVDEADLLTAEEESKLLQKVNEVSQRQQFDIVIVTVNSLDGKTVEAYADDYYDYNNYGYGEEKDGIILLLSMGERQWHIGTTGFGINAFTDAGLEYIEKKIKSGFSDGDFNESFTKFVELCDDFVTQANSGEPYDSKNLPKEPLGAFWLPLSAAVGAIVSWFTGSSAKAKLKPVRRKVAARDYVRKDSIQITHSSERFLYSTVDKEEKPKEKDSDSGSSTHESSSGTTHGGRSGSF